MGSVAIVGAGPAGLSAAINSAAEGLDTTLVEAGRIGGQASASSRIENYAGYPNGVSGWALTNDMRRQACRLGAHIVRARAVGLNGTSVQLDTGRQLSADHVILAPGLTTRAPDWLPTKRPSGAHLAYTPHAGQLAKRHVVVVGGANSAGQAALYAASYAVRVTMLVRHTLETSEYLTRRIRSTMIEVRELCEVTGLDTARGRLVGTDTTTGYLPVDSMLIFTGNTPDTSWLAGSDVSTDAQGYIVCTGVGETAAPNVYAGGDIVAGATHRVASAVGDGSKIVARILAGSK